MAEQRRSLPRRTHAPGVQPGTARLLAAASVGDAPLLLSVSLVLPALVGFSPLLVPAGAVVSLVAAELLISGGCGVAAWARGYATGKRPPGAARADSARRVARTARDVKEWGKGLGPKAREITGHAAVAAAS